MPKGELIVNGRFEWFEEKSNGNKQIHGYSFNEVLSVFDDIYFLETYDEKHSTAGQERYFGLGALQEKCLVLQVSYTENKRIHIISARNATSKEKERYYAGIREIYR